MDRSAAARGLPQPLPRGVGSVPPACGGRRAACVRLHGRHLRRRIRGGLPSQHAGAHLDRVAATGAGGEALIIIHLYTRLHRRPPAETDMQEYFRVSPPSVHQMVLTLERAGYIKRQPRTARSIKLLVDPKHPPDLL